MIHFQARHLFAVNLNHEKGHYLSGVILYSKMLSRCVEALISMSSYSQMLW